MNRPSRSVSRHLAPTLLLALTVGLVLAPAVLAGSDDRPPPPPNDGGGEPPAGEPPPGSPPPGGRQDYTLTGKYTVRGETKATENRQFDSAEDDVSAVFVTDGGALTLTAPTIRTTGSTSSQENSSFFGLNAAALAAAGGQLTILGGTITTTGGGANAAFATGGGSHVTLRRTRIEATGDGGHGVMASAGGTVELEKVDIVTAQAHGAALATDRGGGTITATGGTVVTHGRGSPAVYSTGAIAVTGATLKATGSEGAVIEGSNSITLKDCFLSGERLCGAMIYQSFSGDAQGQHGTFQMQGGAFTSGEGPLFLVTNTHATITLQGVALEPASGALLKAATGRWGRSGRNGGHVRLFAIAQTLVGDIECDALSSAEVSLKQGSTLIGRIDGATISIDGTSTWQVTGNSTIGALQLPAVATARELISCIIGNGHLVQYDPTLRRNDWLKRRSFALVGGGVLQPIERPLLNR